MGESVDITIRRATRADVAALGRLGGMLMRAHYAFDPKRFLAPGDDAESGYGWFLNTQLTEPDVAVFVADQEGAVVGYVYIGVEPLSWKELRDEAGFIHDIAVAEHARRIGIARRLMDAAAEWFRARGTDRMMLWTAQQNTGAQRLFEALGFRRTMVEMTKEILDS
jgi:ribosomal protein S18 acetylase RimI-like enzyme